MGGSPRIILGIGGMWIVQLCCVYVSSPFFILFYFISAMCSGEG